MPTTQVQPPEVTARTDRAAQVTLDKRTRTMVLIAAALVFMATNADGPSFNLTIPTLQREFNASYFAAQIMTNAAQLLVASFVLAAGTLGDIHGRRRWLLIGAIGMFAGYLAQTFAAGVPMIVGARMLVGFSTALTTALTLAVVNVAFADSGRAQAIGIFAGLGSLSAALTPIVSQWLNQTFGWRFSFTIPLILAGIGIFLVWRFVPESRDERPRKLDLAGVLLNAIGLTGIVYGFILAGTQGWTSTGTLMWLGIGVVGLLLFIWWERRCPDPALKLSLFKNPVFALAVFAALILNLVDYAIHPNFSTYLQSVQGRSPFLTSIILLPWALGAAVTAPLAGRVALRMSPHKLIAAGLAICGVTILLARFLTPTSSVWLVLLILIPFALAYGLANIPRTSVLMASAPTSDSGAASAANSMGTETGSALGLAVFGTLIATFATANYRARLEAAIPADRLQEAVNVIRSAIQGTLQQLYPAFPPELLDRLAEGFKQSYTDAMGTAFTIGAILLFIAAAMVWFGMRGRADEPLTEVSTVE